MKWTQVKRDYVCLPYRISAGIQGWDVWLEGQARIARDIASLRTAKAFAQHHAALAVKA